MKTSIGHVMEGIISVGTLFKYFATPSGDERESKSYPETTRNYARMTKDMRVTVCRNRSAQQEHKFSIFWRIGSRF